MRNLVQPVSSVHSVLRFQIFDTTTYLGLMDSHAAHDAGFFLGAAGAHTGVSTAAKRFKCMLSAVFVTQNTSIGSTCNA